jgi:hypothetical protein
VQERAIGEVKSGVSETTVGGVSGRVDGRVDGGVDESLMVVELRADHAAQAIKEAGV